VGSHANKLLNEKGWETVVLDNLVHGHREFAQWGKLVEADLNDRRSLRELLSGEKFDAVMHFAGYIAVGESVLDPELYYHNNVSASLVLLEEIKRAGIGRFIFSSTAAVYGQPLRLPLDEEHPLAPINPYGRTKLMIEQAMRDYSAAYGLKTAALRYFNAAGAAPGGGIGERHDPETHLIPLALEAALGKRPQLYVYGTDYDTPDGTCIRDYVHVDDLAQAHLLALEYLEQDGSFECFNLGNGTGFSVREVIEVARRVSGRDIKAVDSPRREGDPPRLVASSDKAKKVLGWKPQHTGLEDIVRTAWEWHKI